WLTGLRGRRRVLCWLNWWDSCAWMVGVTNHTTAEARPTSDSATVRLGGQQTIDVRLSAGGELEELRRWRTLKNHTGCAMRRSRYGSGCQFIVRSVGAVRHDVRGQKFATQCM